MALKMNLDTIRESVKKKYDSAEVEFGSDTLRLRNPLVLPAKVREEMMTIVSSLGSEKDAEEEFDIGGFKDRVRSLIRLVASDQHVAEKFLSAIAVDDAEEGAEDFELPILLEVFAGYMDDQQVGEA